uniref:Polyadenylate-binding protein n=1 Tax=Oryza nivara TaxID=4536 RepID=A0A0E0FLW4_ORYNI
MEVMMVAMAAEAPVGVEVEAVPAVAGGLNATVPALYVGDLHESVREEHLLEVFGKIGTLTSVRVCRDNATSNSLRYGYVNYLSQADAAIALEKLNHSLILDKPIRVMWSNRDPDARRSGVGNVFVKNLNDLVDNVSLQELFCKFGDILSCKVAKNEDGTSRGYGFVQFALQESADASIQNLNNSHFCGRQLHVATFIKKSERSTNNDDKYTNLYMKNLDDDITEELIKLKFSQYGLVISVKIMKRDDGTSKGFGFVSFQNPESAKRAKESMNGMLLGSKTLYVARAQKKAERKQYLQCLHEEKRNEIITKSNGSNVYIKNINDEVGDDALRERFNEFGNITSAKIMRDEKGISKGFGFVCYNTPEEAKCAVSNMRGVMFYGKPLYVAIAQRKEERRAKLEQRFAELATMVGATSPVIPTGYPQFYFAHPSTHLPQSPGRQGFMYPPIGISQEWRHNMFPSSHNIQQIHSPIMRNTPRQYRNNRGRMNGNMMHFHHTVNYVPHAQPAKEFMSMSRQPDLASKITGMLLELGNSEVVMLLYSSNMLSAKIEECVKLLQEVKPKPEDQEALHPGFLLDSAGVNAN